MAIAACGSSNSSSPSSSGGSTGAADTSPYNILAIYGMTGDLEASAVAVNRGVQAAVDYFNSQGGVNGHKLVLTVKDDQSDPTKAVSILQDAVNSSSPPDDVIPGISSNEGLAMAPVLTRAQIVGLGSASSPALDDPTKYPYFFSQSTLAPTVVASGATFIASHPGVKSVAIVTSNDALGEADVPTLQSTFKAAGIATTVKLFDPTASDYTATYQAAAASHPDWVWMDGAGAEVPIMLSSRLKANLGNVPTVIGNVASSGSLTTYAKGTTQLDNTFATLGPMGAYVAPSDRGPELKAMLKALNEQGALAAPLFVYATGWDYVNYFVNGIQNLNGKDVTGPNLKTALETLPDSSDPQFPMYRPTFDTKTHNPQTPASLFSFGQEVGSKDGMIVLKKAYHSS
ncbi:MAG TPA: ABC transporter substrate-binding protein [Nocardioides sp.]|uniref:ABC transporter substrate-binding protein n=1 Tax=Nocardioides sp. TaxID=35761 RepID=UPI002E307EAE|nr:ABC transporter substrate-binding protein [Nocardioides sp.]HEX3929683.1 ABC transporter substrate-binding protein [Nocardioides sp.]